MGGFGKFGSNLVLDPGEAGVEEGGVENHHGDHGGGGLENGVGDLF